MSDPPDEELRRLVDIDALSNWLDELGIARGAPLACVRVGSGYSNEMFKVARDGELVVLRRPAAVPLEGADRGMAREYRVLCALEGTDVPHPRPVAICEDSAVLGCTFYLMEWVEGFMPVEPLPDAFAGTQRRRQLAHAFVDSLAELARVSWRQRGLEDFGRPADFHDRQVRRWTKQYESYPNQELDGVEDAARWLSERIPVKWTPTIMHGDYHMANLLVGRDLPPRVVAICDWETATIGDPLLDLAGFLRFFTEMHPEAAGWPGKDALIDRYAQRSGLEVPDLSYYTVLAMFRLAVTMEGIYQRSFSDPHREVAREMHAYSLVLVNSMQAAIHAS